MKKQKKSILSWNWIKQNFWNVVLIWLIWQIVLAIIYAIVVQIFGIQVQ
jgi:hypothetical protein